MRSFFAISLALAAGCGDNLSGPVDPAEEGAPEGGAVGGDPVERLLPDVCGTRTWDTVTFDEKDSIIRVVPQSHGAAIFMVPRSGGMLRGFEVDGRGLIMGNEAGVKVRSNGTFTGLSAARVDDRYIVGLETGTHVSVNAIRDDLGDYRELAMVPGTLIGDTPMMHSRNTRIATTGGANGLMMSTFDSAWAPMGGEVVARSVPDSMSSAAYGNDAMVAWSSGNECHIQRVASGIESMRPYACKNNRLAVNYADRGGWMVYEAGQSVMIAKIVTDGHNQIANETQIARFGSSPRIVFDGQRYWVSYLDFHGDVIIGIVDENGTLNSMALEGTQPMAGAHDLAVIAGEAWVYAVDTNGFGASRMCTQSVR